MRAQRIVPRAPTALWLRSAPASSERVQQPAHVLGITDCSLRREASPAPPVPSVFMAAIMLRAAVFAVPAARAQRSSGACVARALSPSHRPLSDALCQPVAPWSLGLASAPAARRPTLRATVRPLAHALLQAAPQQSPHTPLRLRRRLSRQEDVRMRQDRLRQGILRRQPRQQGAFCQALLC